MNYSTSNPRIIDKAEEIKTRPQFKETMSRVFKDKNEKDLRDSLDGDSMEEERRKIYTHASASLKYEKNCARLAAEKMLKAEGDIAPSKEKLDNAEKILRRDERFQNFFRDALKGKEASEINSMNRGLDQQNVKEQTVRNICSRFTEPPKLKLSEAPLQPAVNGPVQSGPQNQPAPFYFGSL